MRACVVHAARPALRRCGSVPQTASARAQFPTAHRTLPPRPAPRHRGTGDPPCRSDLQSMSRAR